MDRSAFHTIQVRVKMEKIRPFRGVKAFISGIEFFLIIIDSCRLS